jgi:hypothetical protein
MDRRGFYEANNKSRKIRCEGVGVLVTEAGASIGGDLGEHLVELGAKIRALVRNSFPKQLARWN